MIENIPMTENMIIHTILSPDRASLTPWAMSPANEADSLIASSQWSPFHPSGQSQPWCLQQLVMWKKELQPLAYDSRMLRFVTRSLYWLPAKFGILTFCPSFDPGPCICHRSYKMTTHG